MGSVLEAHTLGGLRGELTAGEQCQGFAVLPFYPAAGQALGCWVLPQAALARDNVISRRI